MGSYLDKAKMDYLKKHGNSGFKKGDTVWISTKLYEPHDGWEGVWPWDNFVDVPLGTDLTILNDFNHKGFQVFFNDGAGDNIVYLPYYCLKWPHASDNEEIYDEEKSYIGNHRGSGFRLGDYVRIIRKPGSYEKGWDGKWPNSIISWGEISKKNYYIDEDNGLEGFRLACKLDKNNILSGPQVPYFVLEKVDGDEIVDMDGLVDIVYNKQDMPSNEDIANESNNIKGGIGIMGKIKLLVLGFMGLISFFVLIKIMKNIIKDLDNKNIYDKHIKIFKDKYEYIKSKIKNIMEIKQHDTKN